MSVGLSEKKATSDPEIKAEATIKNSRSTMDNIVPVDISTIITSGTAIEKSSAGGSGSKVSMFR